MKKVYLLSLGCARNLVDSEVLLALLEKKGYRIVDEASGADIAIVNTCGFIEHAKQESIDLTLQLVELKKTGKIKKLILSGCLSQRYSTSLLGQIKEIDGIFGTSDFTKIPDMIEALSAGKKVKEITKTPNFLYNHSYKRKLLTLPHYAYVKIQEGCSNKCSYCVIPDLKGPRRSRAIESILEEVKYLKCEHDIKEVVLIGQDTTSFGMDRRRKPNLAELLRKISPLMEDSWIRLLYTHPEHFTDELIKVFAQLPNLCRYIDLPIQHINDRILRQMNRRSTKKDILKLINRLRKEIKDVTLRTSIIVGFPGETEEEFRQLLSFLRTVQFDRLGAFIYSREEGTPAYSFTGQIPDQIKRARFDELMQLQQEISVKNNLKFIDKKIKALVDEGDSSNREQFIARGQMDAPEVDGVIYAKGKKVKVGDFAQVHITGSTEYDLIGEVI